ncbi:MAG: transposase, partial [Deltaproteobacteria bacterium]|nr:transposase [Deltaproteobacteria bacterium]
MSKENRREPIVQVGLFMDNNGLPISFRIYPGNYNDQLTLRPIFAETISKMNFGRIIVVSDGGVNS